MRTVEGKVNDLKSSKQNSVCNQRLLMSELPHMTHPFETVPRDSSNGHAGSRTLEEIDRHESAIRTLDAARGLGPKIRAMADEIEQGRQLPQHLVREMQGAGVFRMAMPRAWGGPELDFLLQIRVIEELSMADASAGWCAMIGVDGGYMTAYIDQNVARPMYSDIDSVTAITFAPLGRALKANNGFIVSG